MLALAVELADYPFDPSAPCLGEALSRTCGSSLRMSSEIDLTDVGLKISACAVGQASAAIFVRHCAGRSEKDLAVSLAQIESWLAGNSPLPDWPDIQQIEPARDYPGRHGAIALPWKAALDALSNGVGPR
ncbi:iron-sulfur cluster assembly scaffold protein [Erythrobacter vulgaris]|uniref:Iron-sulfur cluster assembly scaffold protein n=2 Tax=Qipengyuania vulgaris TaxID=291985 RepID=A0A844XTK7_9SPHN|nr:iron-sulfur cluster assembly scaffold protein [Qipengyuania vulgaris]